MPDLSLLGADSLGVWTRSSALSLLRAGEIDVLVRTGVWQVLWRGVYMDGGFDPTPEQRAIAAVLAAGGAGQPFPVGAPDPETGRRRVRLRAAAWGRTAARVWGFPLIDDDDPATGAAEHVLDHVAVDRPLARQSFADRILTPHEVPLGRRDLVRRPSGLWISSPLRTLTACSGLLTHEALVCAIDFALHHELVSLVDLETAAAGRLGRPGAPALRAAVAVADGRAESPAETLTRLLLLPVLPDLEPQVELYDEGMRLIARFDLGDRRVRLGVEADGKRNHAGGQMVAKDRRRDRSTGRFGWTTERVTWFELRRQQAALVRRVVEVHAGLAAAQPPAA